MKHSDSLVIKQKTQKNKQTNKIIYMKIEFKNSILRLSFLYCITDIKNGWINPCSKGYMSILQEKSNFLLGNTFLTSEYIK